MMTFGRRSAAGRQARKVASAAAAATHAAARRAPMNFWRSLNKPWSLYLREFSAIGWPREFSMARLRDRNEWKLFAALAKADRFLAAVWWLALVLRGLLPAVFGVAMGLLVAAVQTGGGLAAPLTFAGIVFVLLQ